MGSSIVFLSYSHSDRGLAEQLTKDLENKGLSVWRDVEKLSLGADIVETILRAIRESSNFLALVSSKSSESMWFSSELATALASKEASPNLRIIPIVTEQGIELPLFLRQFKAVDLSTPQKYKEHLPRLLEALTSDAYVGPLPPPQFMKHYGKIYPGFAERILRLTEIEAHKRMQAEKSYALGRRLGFALIGSLLGALVIAAITIWGKDGNSHQIFIFLGGLVVGILYSLISSAIRKTSNNTNADGDVRD